MSEKWLGLITGLVFGYALYRAGFFQCGIVHRGLWLRDFTMLKVMLTAIVVGLVGSTALDALMPGAIHFKVKSLHLWGIIAGAAVFGLGMALAGYCPGTVLVGAAGGRKEGIAALVGALTGTVAFIYAYPLLKPVFFEVANFGKVTLPSLTGLPAVAVALVLAAVLAGVVGMLSRIERTRANQTTRDKEVHSAITN